ncbi:MAG: ABC transporter ATP-binding protein [Candidatus Melainabacteria bacterium]
MASVTLKHLQKHFGDTRVIEDLSLDITDREFLVLVGPSGCGKSTVLRMIAGLETPSGGEIRIGDTLVNNVLPKDRDIAMVFQNYALYPHMSVYDNMAFGLKMRKTPRPAIDEKVRQAAGILDLEPLLSRKPKQLSGGQRQRVALGRAIVRDPKVFLMDEPLSNLDAKLRVQMRTEIGRLHQRLNATTVYVTHDQVEAMTMGDRIVVLNQGRIQQVDTPDTVYHHPANLFVAGFIGQMNFLTGILTGNQFRLGDGQTIPLPDGLPGKPAPTDSSSGQGVILGIRPEHFHLAGAGEPSDHTLPITPNRVELLGGEKLVHFTLSGEAVIARLPSDVDVAADKPMTLGIALTRASLFDGATQARIN